MMLTICLMLLGALGGWLAAVLVYEYRGRNDCTYCLSIHRLNPLRHFKGCPIREPLPGPDLKGCPIREPLPGPDLKGCPIREPLPGPDLPKVGGCGVRGCPNLRPHSHVADLLRRVKER